MANRKAAPTTQAVEEMCMTEDFCMSLEMTPIAIKLTPEVLAVLRGESELTGVHMKEIARRVLKAWADKRAHEANVINKHLRRHGFNGVDGIVSDDQEP